MRLHGGSRREGTTGLVLVVGSVLLLALHVFLVRDVSVPSVVPDEAGYLGNARWLSGTSPTWIMGEAPYYGFGYSLVLAPLFAVFHDPYTLYRAVIVVNALLVTSLFPLLYVFCRRLLGATERVALVAALVGALVPAATAYTAVAPGRGGRAPAPRRRRAHLPSRAAGRAGRVALPGRRRAPPGDALPLHAPRPPGRTGAPRRRVDPAPARAAVGRSARRARGAERRGRRRTAHPPRAPVDQPCRSGRHARRPVPKPSPRSAGSSGSPPGSVGQGWYMAAGSLARWR